MIDIGKNRECFFDDYLIDTERTDAEKRLHKPERRGLLLRFDRPWEGSEVTFITVLFSEGLYRMYYVCNHGREKYVCYAESRDGEGWDRPRLGMIEFNGSTDNNIMFDVQSLEKFEFTGFDNMSVFYDECPSCPADERYKMLCWWQGHAALICLLSADGIHFDRSRFITDDGAFDSRNSAFYSKAHGKYFCYYRGEHEPGKEVPLIDKSYTDRTASALYDPEKFLMREPGDGTHTMMRDVRVIESEDFKRFSKQKRIAYSGRRCQMYNNNIFAYPRAPQLLIGFPLRYVERKAWTKNYDELCGREDRLERMKRLARFGLAVTDGIFMCSRDGYTFTKYDEAIFPPTPENPEGFVYGDGTATPMLVEISSEIPGADNEYMIYLRESYRTARDCSKLVKYTLRLDGFVSMHAGGDTRRLVTKEFVYTGEDLFANIATSARGGAYFTLASKDEVYRSYEIFGNATDKRIRFEDEAAVARLAGKPVTLTVEMLDCDLYAIRFA